MDKQGFKSLARSEFGTKRSQVQILSPRPLGLKKLRLLKPFFVPFARNSLPISSFLFAYIRKSVPEESAIKARRVRVVKRAPEPPIIVHRQRHGTGKFFRLRMWSVVLFVPLFQLACAGHFAQPRRILRQENISVLRRGLTCLKYRPNPLIRHPFTKQIRHAAHEDVARLLPVLWNA